MLGALDQQLLHRLTGLPNRDVDELGHVVGDLCVDTGEKFVDQGVLQACIVVSLVDVLQEGFDGGEDVARDDGVDFIDLALVVPREVLLVLVAAGLDFVQTHFQEVAIGPEISRHQL